MADPKDIVRAKINKPEQARTKKQLALISETITAILATKTLKDAAAYIGIHETNIHRRLKNYPEINEVIDARLADVRRNALQNLQANIPKYLDNIGQLAESANSENVRLNASADLLDRAGFIKPSGQQTNVQVNVLNQLKKHGEEYDL